MEHSCDKGDPTAVMVTGCWTSQWLMAGSRGNAMEEIAEMPFMIPSEIDDLQNIKTYTGFIDIYGRFYYVKLHVPEHVCDSRLECEWSLHQRLQPKMSLIQQRLTKSENVCAFWKEFKLIAETCMKDENHDLDLQSEWCEYVLREIQEVSNGTLLSVDETFSVVNFEVCDRAGRQHKIKISLNKLDRSKGLMCETDLPQKFEFHSMANSRLQHLVEQFEAVVESYQEFWDTMRDIDEKCWILEPENPSYSSTQRRIALGSNLSLHITVNSLQAKTLPECRFFGAESSTAPLKEQFNINLRLWDVERSLLNNLQEVLLMDFPSPSHGDTTELTVDCGICYCLHLNGKIPDIVCEDKRCAQAFHCSCLYEWFRNLNARQTFHTIFGECPLCNHPINVKKQYS